MILPQTIPSEARRRQFEFARDTFAFANELLWRYEFDPAAGKTAYRRRERRPGYAHRCFVLSRAARQFLYHARFDASQPAAGDETCRRLVREIVSRNLRTPCESARQVVIPGFAGLRDFSRAREPLLKAACGGAWRSYCLRSHWRMVFPITRAHQARMAARLSLALSQTVPPIIHLVKFPSLTINHGMMLFGAAETGRGIEFQAYDPNDPGQPARLVFDRASRTFHLPANSYWAGGGLDVIEIYRNWFF
jgi:hypothetical protein